MRTVHTSTLGRDTTVEGTTQWRKFCITVVEPALHTEHYFHCGLETFQHSERYLFEQRRAATQQKRESLFGGKLIFFKSPSLMGRVLFFQYNILQPQ